MHKSVQNVQNVQNGQNGCKVEKHYAQRGSKSSEWLSKMKRKSSCLRAFVRDMFLMVLHSSVQDVQNDCKTEKRHAQRGSKVSGMAESANAGR